MYRTKWEIHQSTGTGGGVVVASNGQDLYEVRLDGSRRLTKKNRKFLRPFHPAVQLGQVKVPVTQPNTTHREPAAQPDKITMVGNQELAREEASLGPGADQGRREGVHQQELALEMENKKGA